MDYIYNLEAWQALVSVHDEGSLSAAAECLNTEPSSISRLIAGLEKNTGKELVIRHERPSRLTEDAIALVTGIRPILKAHSNFIARLKADNALLEGTIRLGVAGGLMHSILMPMLMEFQERYPKIEFDIKGGRLVEECSAGRIDVASISGEPESRDLIKIARGRSIFIPVASPHYLARKGIPLTPESLVNHTGFVYTGPVRSATTELFRDNQVRQLKWGKRIQSTDILLIKEAVLGGAGIAVDLPLLHCAKELQDGSLVAILDGWHRPPIPAYAVCSTSVWHTKRIRLFMQWYCERFQRIFAESEEIARTVLGDNCRHYFGSQTD